MSSALTFRVTLVVPAVEVVTVLVASLLIVVTLLNVSTPAFWPDDDHGDGVAVVTEEDPLPQTW